MTFAKATESERYSSSGHVTCKPVSPKQKTANFGKTFYCERDQRLICLFSLHGCNMLIRVYIYIYTHVNGY